MKDEIEARYREDNFHVVAAGIDAPLLWNKRGDRQGYRKAEDDLATALEAIGRRPPTAAYRLPGEVTMQGPLIAWYLGAEWNVAITESYPRVFRQLLEYINRCDLLHTADRLMQGLTPSSRRPEECEHGHEQDATLLAMAAWAAIQNPPLPNWQNLYDGDDCLFNPSGVPVSYWMPIPATNQPH
ncbi:MAG: hypothetical protein F4X64_16845 [Chloroflexi bacterium]|nr:hypothetical protein [Chloroflexota bacterium]